MTHEFDLDLESKVGMIGYVSSKGFSHKFPNSIIYKDLNIDKDVTKMYVISFV